MFNLWSSACSCCCSCVLDTNMYVEVQSSHQTICDADCIKMVSMAL